MFAPFLWIPDPEIRRNEFLSQLYRSYARTIYRLACSYLHDAHMAEDAVQETFLTAQKYCETIRKMPEEKRLAYLAFCVRSRCFDMIRQQKRACFVEMSSIENIPDTGPENTWDTVISTVQTEQIRKALDKLPECDRDLLRMRYYQDKTYAEISGILGLKESTVRSEMTCARRHLALLLKGSGLE